MEWNWITIFGALAYLGALSYLIGILGLFIIPANRKPGEATAWLLLIVLAPVLGVILFVLLGNPKLSKWRREQQRAMNEPVDRIVQDIDAARRFVHVEYFMFADDKIGGPVIAALVRARERGVICRVLIDHLSNLLLEGPVLRKLGAAGIPVRRMLPANPFDNEWNRIDLRNHRKIVVVDGTVGFTGSHNLIEDTYHKRSNIRKGIRYIELVVRVTGPVVREFNAAFITDWYSETQELLDERTAPELRVRTPVTGDVPCQVLPSGPGFEHNNNLMLFVSLLHAARRRITITNPYIVPEETLLLALTSAAQRGVEVTLLVSEIGDQFLVYHAQGSYYEELLKAGVKICRYQAPLILHSKSISIDDDIAVIGSSNMDIRSFQLNLEITLVCYSAQVVSELRKLEEEYLHRSHALSLEAWQARPLHTRLFENLARLTSALQ
jgi:cardiolipin synthase